MFVNTQMPEKFHYGFVRFYYYFSISLNILHAFKQLQRQIQYGDDIINHAQRLLFLSSENKHLELRQMSREVTPLWSWITIFDRTKGS